jgi:hypothetical protein
MKDTGRKLVVAVVVAAAGLSAWRGANATPQADSQSEWARAPRVASQSYRQSPYGNLSRPVALVASSAREWDEEMARLLVDGGLLAAPAEAGADLEVDWRRYSLVLVGLGEQLSGQYKVSVGEVRRHGNELLLDVRVDLADPGAVRATSPYHMVLVERGNWTSVVSLYDCGSGVAGAGGKGRRLGADGAGAGRADRSGPVTWAAVKDLYR